METSTLEGPVHPATMQGMQLFETIASMGHEQLVLCQDAASGDPSPVTAHGVFRAIQAAAKERWGTDDVSTRTVALQGCGHVGYYLAKELHEAGAKLVVTDIDPERVKRVTNEFGARPVATEEIYGVQADIFAPCAVGAILNDKTIPQLK